MNFPVGALELISFFARSDRFCYLRSAEIPSRVFLLVFPCWVFNLIVLSQGTQFYPVGGLLLFSFLGELHGSGLIFLNSIFVLLLLASSFVDVLALFWSILMLKCIAKIPVDNGSNN